MSTPSPVPAAPSLRSLGPSLYAPSFLFSVGQGAVIPIAALVARDLGGSVAMAGVVVAVRGLGTLAFDLPAGWLVSRYGERRSMSLATVMLLASLIGCVTATSVITFAAFMFLMGCSWAVWLLARMAYVSDVMPIHLRGRALSVLGGTMRIGNFVGPFLGALAVGPLGLDGAYYVHIVLAVAGLGVLLAVPSLQETGVEAHGPVSFRSMGRAHTSIWLTAGVGAMCIGVLRACRPVVLPLWADHVGVDAAAVSVIFGLSSAMDMTLFYPAGAASDRWGRKYVAVPCMAIMAVGFAVMPLARSFWPLVLVGVVLGFGNGLGSGIIMTLGADFAPLIGRAEFLGVWRLIGDVGTAGGPFLAAGVSGAAGLGPASLTVAVIGLAGAGLVLFRMPEPLRGTRETELRPPVDDDAQGLTT